MKKYLVMLLAAAMILSMAGCQQETATAEIPETPKQELTVETEKKIEITEEVPEAYVQFGYNRTAKTDHADYFFNTELVSDGEKLISQAELIVSKAMDDFKIQPNFTTPITICYQQESPRYDGRGTTSTLKITPDYSKEEGRITYFLAQGKLPAWLCIGLERHWLAEAGEGISDTSTVELSQWAKVTDEKALPSFSDVWFIPNLIEDDLSKDRNAVAEQFVAYLDKEGRLQELVAAYLDPEQLDTAETLRRTIWEKATGVKATDDDGMTYQYMIDQYVSSGDSGELLFRINTDRANIYFSPADFWTLEKVKDYALVSDSSISGTEQWFDYTYEKPYTIMYVKNEAMIKLAGMSTNFETDTIEVYCTERTYPIGFGHEIVHLTLYHKGIDNKGLYAGQYDLRSNDYMEEGLCHTVGSLCDGNSSNPVLAKNYSENAHLNMQVRWGEEYLDEYFNRSHHKDKTKLEARIWFDMAAIKAIETMEKEGKLSGDKIDYLIDQETMASFYFYLLEDKGTKEDLMKIYQDISCFEEVYGQSLTDMIDEWLEHLENNY